MIIDCQIPNSEIVDISDKPQPFIDLLPEDWKAELEQNWSELAPFVKVYGIEQNSELLGGGLVFIAYTPETDNYPQVAKHYFNNGFLYVGYLWVEEHLRGKGLGDFWLQSIFDIHSNHQFWLAIQDDRLANFYLRNGFKLEREIIYEEVKDWIYVKNSNPE